MALSVVMPALEMAQETGKLLAWLKQEGDTITKGEMIAEKMCIRDSAWIARHPMFIGFSSNRSKSLYSGPSVRTLVSSDNP